MKTLRTAKGEVFDLPVSISKAQFVRSKASRILYMIRGWPSLLYLVDCSHPTSKVSRAQQVSHNESSSNATQQRCLKQLIASDKIFRKTATPCDKTRPSGLNQFHFELRLERKLAAMDGRNRRGINRVFYSQ